MKDKILKNSNDDNIHEFDCRLELLNTFENSALGTDYFIKISYTKFKYLCPLKGVEDLGEIHIKYIPDKYCLEATSVRPYFYSFATVTIFNEDITNTIINDLIELLDPNYIEVLVKVNPKNGLSMNSYVNYGKKDSKYEKMALKRLESNDVE
ncbi:preQ(1) synthase [Methanobrevibacter sp.]|uniref:preQ(1) synthase n=1 Tax=Methanobrevibacter sp. TaxID=66852 RepID=UPI00388E1474